jgi:hypothetical protein
MDQLLDFFRQMSPLQIVMLAGGVIIGWPVVRDNLFKSAPAVVDVDDDDDEDILDIDSMSDNEVMETYWFLLYQACSNIEDEQAKEEVRNKMVDISKHIF